MKGDTTMLALVVAMEFGYPINKEGCRTVIGNHHLARTLGWQAVCSSR